MSNPSKRKGTAAESALAKRPGWIRLPPGGADLVVANPHGKRFLAEVKNRRNLDIPAALLQAARNASPLPGVVVIKPVGVGLDRTDDWWVIMRLEDWEEAALWT